MFQRYTESARRALFFARYAVSRLGADQIEPEHLLLGLMRVQWTTADTDVLSATTAATLLKSAGIDRDAVERRMGTKPPLPTSVEIPFSASTKRCLLDAEREADHMNAAAITTGHLLLGLLQADGTDACSLLYDAGLRLNEARLRVEADIAAGTEGEPPP